MSHPSTYKSYLLRMWQVTHDGCAVWQASIQSTATGDRITFADLDSLFVYLKANDVQLVNGSTELQAVMSESTAGS